MNKKARNAHWFLAFLFTLRNEDDQKTMDKKQRPLPGALNGQSLA